MRKVKIKFKENGKIFFDEAIIGKTITEEQAQGLVEQGIARIIEINENEEEVEKENE